MTEITASAGVGRPRIFDTVGHAIGEAFLRYRKRQTKHELAALDGRLLKDMGFDRANLSRTSVTNDISTWDGFYVPRHLIG